jgi:hypothetical protein
MTVTLDPRIDEAVRSFSELYLNGIPMIIRDGTAFLAFICVLTATEALAAYRYEDTKPGTRFKKFLEHYFPAPYGPHLEKLWLFRCRMVHAFSPAYFSLTHHNRHLHLTTSLIGDTVLNAENLFDDLSSAAAKFFDEVRAMKRRQKQMLKRLIDIDHGGAIAVA